MANDKIAYREFVREHIVVKKVERQLSQYVTEFLYLVFAKPPFANSLSPDELKKLAAELRKADKKLLFSSSKVLALKNLPVSLRLGEPFLHLLGFVRAFVFQLSNMSQDEFYFAVKKFGVEEDCLVSLLADFYPLQQVSARHKRRGVGGKVLGYILSDLKGFGVEWVYLVSLSRESAAFMKKRSFEAMRGTPYLCRKL